MGRRHYYFSVRQITEHTGAGFSGRNTNRLTDLRLNALVGKVYLQALSLQAFVSVTCSATIILAGALTH